MKSEKADGGGVVDCLVSIAVTSRLYRGMIILVEQAVMIRVCKFLFRWWCSVGLWTS